MQHKSVPLLIKSATTTSGTFTGLASVFDNLDHDGDIVRRGAFSKSLGSGTRRYRWSGCTRLMTHAAMSVMSSRPPRPTTVWRSRAGLISTPSSASRPTETPRAAECQVLSIGYVIRNATKTAAGNELTHPPVTTKWSPENRSLIWAMTSSKATSSGSRAVPVPDYCDREEVTSLAHKHILGDKRFGHQTRTNAVHHWKDNGGRSPELQRFSTSSKRD